MPFATVRRSCKFRKLEVANEFLPALVGETLVDQVLREGPRWFRPDRDGGTGWTH